MASVIRPADSLSQPFAQVESAFSLDRTLRENLTDMHQRIDQIIATCRSELILGAAKEAHLAINALRTAYRDSLDHTLNCVDQTILETLLRLDSLMKEMEARNYSKIESLVEPIVSQLHDANSYPTISSTWPRCVVWPIENAVDSNIFVRIKGYFPKMEEQLKKPFLSLNHHTYQPILLSSSEIGFQAPLDRIFSSTSDHLSIGELVVPHAATNTNYRFPVVIGALPQSPGSIVVEHHKTVIQREISEPQIEWTKLSSTRSAGHRLQQKTIVFQAKPGWKILDHGIKPTNRDERFGDYRLVCLSASDTRVEYSAETRPHANNHRCGRLSFTLFFREYRDVPVATPIEKAHFTLGWGEKSPLIPLKTSHWKVIFTPFDGSPVCELTQPETNNPFINVSVTGNQLEISAKKADEVHLVEAITAIGKISAQNFPNYSTKAESGAVNTVQSDSIYPQLPSKL